NGQNLEYGSGPAWLYCIDPTKKGDISPELAAGPKGQANPNSGMVWGFGGMNAKDKQPYLDRTLSNVAVHDGLVIGGPVGGTVHCLDANTGQRYWVHATKHAVLGSPLIVDGKVYIGTMNADVWVFSLSKKKNLLHQIEMPERVEGSPVFAHG